MDQHNIEFHNYHSRWARLPRSQCPRISEAPTTGTTPEALKLGRYVNNSEVDVPQCGFDESIEQ